MKAIPSALAIAVTLASFGSAASAQEGPTPITVLAFTETGETDGMGMELYNALRTQIEFHREFRLNDVPPQSLDDMLLAVGCATLDAECSALLADVVGTRLLAWGELRVDDQFASLRMTLWDLERAAEVRSRSHIVGRADRAVLLQNHQVVGRSLLYGDEGTLTVTAAPAGANVTVSGVDRGVAPVEVDGLGFGFYQVRIAAQGYEPREEVVVVDLGGAHLDATLRPEIVHRERERERSRLDPTVPQWLLIGTGAAATTAGIVFAVQKNQTQSEFDDVTSRRVLDRERAQDLEDEGERQATMSTAFVAGGATLLAAGIVWRIVDSGPDDDDAADPWAGVGGYADADGGGLTWSTRF